MKAAASGYVIRGGRTDVLGRRAHLPGSTVPELDSPLLVLDGCTPPRLTVVRSWLRDQLRGVDQQLRIDAELVVTELIANAHDHGGGADTVRIYVHRRPPQVRVEVDDGLPQAPLTVGRSRWGGFRGRGLTIVDSVAGWGVVRRARDKTVWATVGPGPQVSLAPRRP
ncbi:ATP-binding protein [Pseudonocardia sp. ICBG1034]|uniref:ATP-binding protein n=1 Tax=Pseudonocardia sp. ICBG1034 TaxID=2844381 RepID=UPI001CCB0ACB|nr:ATP-binding protein [Pseudonocardia sp. ICBG1034]